MGEKNLDVAARLRPALRSFEPYDPAFSPCRVNLSANENTHELPDEAREAISAALLATPLNLRDALARRHGTDRAHVVVGNGGDELLFNLLFAFGGPGRVLVTCPPDFAEYANFARMTETEVRGVPRDADDFSIDADALAAVRQIYSELFHQVKSASAWQIAVQNERIHTSALQQHFPFPESPGRHRVIPLQPERHRKPLPQGFIILNNPDFYRHILPLLARSTGSTTI